MAITPKTPSNVSAPNTLTQESAASVAVPNTLTQESAASVAVPNTLTQETAASVAVPNTLTQETAASVAIPNTLTQESAASVAVPNTLTQESAATVAVPNTLTQESAAGFPRCLTPKIAFDFADEKYSLCGEPKALSDITTYSRASSATFINRRVDGCTGDYEYFVDTDHVGSVTNLLTYSEQFDNADWANYRASVIANATIDPNGNRTADKLVESTDASNIHHVQQESLTVTTATNYTFSVYAKAGTRKFIRLRETDGITGGAYFNLESGAIGSIAGTGDPLPTIEHVGDGWYRCSLTFTSSGTSSTPRILLAESDGGESYTGDGESYVYIWGAQLTESAKPLPYVQTTTASASNTFSESVRIEYDPATGDSLGALIEGASTNLCLRSEEFDNVSWNKSNVTITANDTVAPDSTTSTDKMAASSTANILVNLNQAVTSVAANDYTTSFYVKAGAVRFVQIYYASGHAAGNPRANFDLSTGALGVVDSEITATIKDIGDGWYRIASTVEAAGTSLQSHLALMQSSTDTRAQANSWTAGDGVYLWGAQVEELPFPSSYIRTEGSSVSRSADNAYYDGSNESLGNESTRMVEVNIDHLPTGGTGSVRRILRNAGGGSTFSNIQIDTDGGLDAFYGTGSEVAAIAVDGGFSATFKSATTYSGGTIKGYLNGIQTVSTSASGFNNDLSPTTIGYTEGGTDNLFGHVKRIEIYDKALTAKEVELL